MQGSRLTGVVLVVCLLGGGVSFGGDYATSLVNRSPTANPGPAPRAVQPGVAATFDARASQDVDGEVVSATWDFGDGTRAEGLVVDHTYAEAGAWLALLTVRDDYGAAGSVPFMVHVGPQPKLVTEDVRVPVSDGYALHARVTRPDDGARHPVVMRYSLYCVSFDAGDEALARSGYAFIAAEAPGVCASEGSFDLFGPAVGRGGRDLVEWAAGASWSDGKVALVGHSGPAITGMAAARLKPRGLATVVFGSTYIDAYRDAVYPGGVLSAVGPEYAAVVAAQPRPGMDAATRPGDFVAWETNVVQRPADDSFWQERSLSGDYGALEVPAYLLLSWDDLFARGALEFFGNRVHPESRIAMYPGPHWPFDPTGTMGFRTIRDQAVHAGSEERVWLDRWMKGVGPADARPDAALFVQEGGALAAQAFSRGEWIFTDDWPVAGTDWQRWHLHGGRGGGAASVNDGTLGPAAPGEDADDLLLPSPTSGVFDPQWLDFWAAAGHRSADGRPLLGAPDRTADEAQGLTFTTAPLDAPLRVIGPVTLTFRATLLGPDAAFFAMVSDVWPDGSSHLVSRGALRASMRAIDETRTLRNDAGEIARVFHPHDRFEPLTPGEEAEYVVEIWPVANVFAPGHRLRLTLFLEKTPWSVPEASAAGALIHHDAARPAWLHLPVVP